MLTDAELQALFDARSTPPEGVARIRHIRQSLPARVARTNKMSGKTRYAPLKMPFVLEAEATATEYVAVVECDHDPDVLEFYTQVEPLRIEYLIAGSARRTHVLTTPDIFKITRDAFVFVECKTEKELVRLAEKNPNRFQRDEAGLWRSPPAERAAIELGCLFEVRSSSQNNWTLHENLELLKDYRTGKNVSVDEASRRCLVDRLCKKGWASVFDLVHVEPCIPADALFVLISQGTAYFPLGDMRLAEQERALVFRDEITYRAHASFLSGGRPATVAIGVPMRPGSSFIWDGNPWQIINASDEGITVQTIGHTGRSPSPLAHVARTDFEKLVRQGRITAVTEGVSENYVNEAEQLLQNANPCELKEAQLRFRAVQAFAAHERIDGMPALRTLFDWQRRYREAEARFGNGFVGLLPRRRGNRRPKISEETLRLVEEVIASDWETIRRKSYAASYGKYRTLAKASGLTPISQVTFWKRAKGQAGFAQKVKRYGEKAAYADEPQYMELEYTTPMHGVRPWHIAHIDHTPLPLSVIDSQLAKNIGTIWLTMLSDANTRKVLAFYLSFDEPSYRSCMMVLRDCVRRHNRVPQIIVSDQGPEFNSEYWETQLAMLGCTKRERRAGRPRAGTVCERLFHTTQSQFVTNLLGSTDILEQHFRSVSPEVRPERHAVWTLERFDAGFQSYLENVFHKNRHGGIGMSPDEAWTLGMRAFGAREHLTIPYNDAFIAQSCPAVHRRKAKVTPAGIKVKWRWFKCEAFWRPGVVGTDVHARYDPFNAGIAYAYVHGQWHKCFSQYYSIYKGLSEKAIWLLTERVRLTDRISGREAGINAERLAVHLLTVEEEEIALQQTRDRETAAHRDRINTQSNAPRKARSISPPRSAEPVEARLALVPQPLEDL
nr:DDE-type integrase/transposase/recombinase [uncultured Caldimonas sp.]